MPFVCAAPEQILKDAASWEGPKDCSFRFGVCYDAQYIYLAVDVTDDEINSQKDTYSWSQDGLEIRFDARPEAVRSISRGEGEMWQFVLVAISPSQSADEPFIFHPKELPAGMKYVCLRKEGGYTAEIAFPAAYLNEKEGKEWDGFRLSIAANDRDDGRQTQIWWHPDWRTAETYPGSGTFQKK